MGHFRVYANPEWGVTQDKNAVEKPLKQWCQTNDRAPPVKLTTWQTERILTTNVDKEKVLLRILTKRDGAIADFFNLSFLLMDVT